MADHFIRDRQVSKFETVEEELRGYVYNLYKHARAEIRKMIYKRILGLGKKEISRQTLKEISNHFIKELKKKHF